MPRFVVAEHSLRKRGGHYLRYSLEILTAAEEAGYEPIAVVNREFQDIECFPEHWQVLPLFDRRAQRLHRQPSAANLRGRAEQSYLVRRLGAVVERGRVALKSLSGLAHRRRYVADFAASCRELLDAVPLGKGDLVFFPTIGDMDLLGLAQVLGERPETSGVSWHMQFHNVLFHGRDPEYPGQERQVRGLRERFAAIRRRLPKHDLTYHSPADSLTRQFHVLGETSARTLPWPIGPTFRPRSDKTIGDPLRLVLAGALRQEKGSKTFRPLYQAVAGGDYGGRRLQFRLQCSDKRLHQDLAGLPTERVADELLLEPERIPTSPILAFGFPLAEKAYPELIRCADIGVMAHSADEYFARLSAVLVEFVASATPVIAPSACWLSDQIQATNDEFLTELLERSRVLRSWDSDQAGELDISDGRASLEIEVEPTGADLLVRLEFGAEQPLGCYARIQLEQFDADGHPVTSLSRTVAARPGSDRETRPATLFHLHPGAVRARLRIDQAFDHGSLRMKRAEVSRITSAESPHRPAPMGRVGLGMDAPEFAPQLVQDIIAHYGHYREQALRFAGQYCHEHAPERTVEILTGQFDGPPV